MASLQPKTGGSPFRTTRLTSKSTCRIAHPVSIRLFCSSHFVQIFNIRPDSTIHTLHFWILRLDHVIFVRGLRAAPMPETKVTGVQMQRFASEDIPGPR